VIVQAVGVITTHIVLLQLAIAGAMPLPAFTATSTWVVVGFILNLLNYQELLRPSIWRLWNEAVTIVGVTVLPQVMWSTFQQFLPETYLPSIICGTIIVALVIAVRMEKAPEKVVTIMGGVSAWTATLFFMWGPIAQMWTNLLNPSNIKGLSSQTVLLAMSGNAMLQPRAIFIRDFMWYAGTQWGCLLAGVGNLLAMYMNDVVSGTMFYGVTTTYVAWIVFYCYKDSQAYRLTSIFTPMYELVTGGRKHIVTG
jgi:hypothetical protein